MSTPFYSQTTRHSADGTIETRDGSHILRFERYLPTMGAFSGWNSISSSK